MTNNYHLIPSYFTSDFNPAELLSPKQSTIDAILAFAENYSYLCNKNMNYEFNSTISTFS